MPWSGGILRLGGPEPRPRHPARGRPCTPETVERVRALWEGTRRSPKDIAASVGLHPVTLAGWARSAGWVRPPFAPGQAAAGRVGRTEWERRRSASGRALAAAERYLAELEGDEAVDLYGLAGALSLLQSSRELEGTLHRRPPATSLSAGPAGSGLSGRSG